MKKDDRHLVEPVWHTQMQSVVTPPFTGLQALGLVLGYATRRSPLATAAHLRWKIRLWHPHDRGRHWIIMILLYPLAILPLMQTSVWNTAQPETIPAANSRTNPV